jgi:hypothetical protein
MNFKTRIEGISFHATAFPNRFRESSGTVLWRGRKNNIPSMEISSKN